MQQTHFKAVGVDVSVWTGQIDWRVLKEAGIDFTYIRTGGGGFYTDDRFRANASMAAEVKLPHGLCYYFVPYSDPLAQAQHFYDLTKSCEGSLLPPVLDIEIPYNGRSPVEFAQRVEVCVAEIAHLFGRLPVIHTRTAFWDHHLEVPVWARECDLWIAQWTDEPIPQLPRSWSHWLLCQRRSNHIVPGIRHRINLSVFNGTTESFQAYIDHGALPFGAN